MSKATVDDVIEMGFSAEQFGAQTDFSGKEGFVAGIINDVALEVRVEVGATLYEAADSAGSDVEKLNFKRLKTAEMNLAASVLWRRIENYERRSSKLGGGESGTETIGSRALRNAEEFEGLGWDEVALITGRNPRDSGMSMSVSESGPYPKVTS